MIFKILKNYSYQNIKAAIDYHELKVENGVASKDQVLATIPMDNSSVISDTLSNHMSINNPRKRGSHFHHISVNFAIEDKLDLPTKRNIIQEYLEGMGYDNTLRCAYRHNDKAHDHWHIFTSASTIDGKLINTRNDHLKSVSLSRSIEKSYGLRTLADHLGKANKENDIDNFRYAKGIQKYQVLMQSDGEDLHPAFQLAISEKGDRMTNEEIRSLYKVKNQSENFQIMIRLLTQADMIETSRKSKMIKRAGVIKNESSNIQEFIEKYNDEKLGFYARYLANKGDISYGYQSLFINGYKLDPEFSWTGLNKHWNIGQDKELNKEEKVSEKQNQDFFAVKKFVRSRVYRLSYYASSFEDLTKRLEKEDIGVDLTVRKDGNTSLVFSHMGYKIKSSALKLTHKQLVEKIENLRKEQKSFINKINNRKSIAKVQNVFKSTTSRVSSNSQQAAQEEENKQQWKYRNPDI